MKAYVDRSGKEYSLHCMDKQDLLVIHNALKDQVCNADTVKTYLLKNQKQRIFNIIKKIENEVLID